MRIRSQNNELIILEPFGIIFIDQDDMMIAYHIYVHVNQGKLLVGEYSTKEKAERVLDMMVAHIEAGKDKNCCFKKGRTVFQMPQDQDVDTTKTLEQTQDVCKNMECAYNTGEKCPAAEGCGGYEGSDDICDCDSTGKLENALKTIMETLIGRLGA